MNIPTPQEQVLALTRRVTELEASLAILPAEPAVILGELHLLEEVCAFYVNDEERTANGCEPYGSVPTEVGMKARCARKRFMEREAANQATARASEPGDLA